LQLHSALIIHKKAECSKPGTSQQHSLDLQRDDSLERERERGGGGREGGREKERENT